MTETIPPVTPEFSHKADIRAISSEPIKLRANQAERNALAKRFGIVSISSLNAKLEIEATGTKIVAAGRLRSSIMQSCAISAEDLKVYIDEQIRLIFVQERAVDKDEIELEEAECDEILYSGKIFDLGEAVAQSLALAIDPYLTGPNAEEARQKAGLSDGTDVGPFAALAALKKD